METPRFELGIAHSGPRLLCQMQKNSGEVHTVYRWIASEKLSGLDPRNTKISQFLAEL